MNRSGWFVGAFVLLLLASLHQKREGKSLPKPAQPGTPRTVIAGKILNVDEETIGLITFITVTWEPTTTLVDMITWTYKLAASIQVSSFEPSTIVETSLIYPDRISGQPLISPLLLVKPPRVGVSTDITDVFPIKADVVVSLLAKANTADPSQGKDVSKIWPFESGAQWREVARITLKDRVTLLI